MVEQRTHGWPLRYPMAVLLVVCAACADGKSEKPAAATHTAAIAESAGLAVRADFLGHLLYDEYRDESAGATGVRETAIQTADAAIKDGCHLPYTFVFIPGSAVRMPVQQVPLAGRDSVMVYAIAFAGSDKIAFGRHYRIELDSTGKIVRSAIASTKDCLAMSKSELAGAAAIDHDLSPGPTEFHVFLSLLHETAFRVRAPTGLWSIDNGTVDLVAPNPSYRPAESTLVSCAMPGGWTMTTTDATCRSNGGTILK